MSRKTPTFDAANLAAAVIIENPELYGGEDGLMVRHSRLVLARLERKPAPRPAAAGEVMRLALVEEPCRRVAAIPKEPTESKKMAGDQEVIHASARA